LYMNIGKDIDTKHYGNKIQESFHYLWGVLL
jgi:hypothetical protein